MKTKKIPKDSGQPLFQVSPEVREINNVPTSWKKLVLYVFEEKLTHKSIPTQYIIGYDALVDNPIPSNLYYDGLFETTYAGRRRIKPDEEYLFVLTKENKFRSIHFSQKTLEKWILTKTIIEKEEIQSILA
jgi:hypothetical protein